MEEEERVGGSQLKRKYDETLVRLHQAELAQTQYWDAVTSYRKETAALRAHVPTPLFSVSSSL